MIYAGEDPRFMFRRMLIFAGEDVGLADPNAIRVVTACAQAFDYVGLPEGRFHLAEACLYLATAPKSNSSLGFFDALGVVEEEREAEVPTHLRDANRDAKGFGHGEGYLYPHAYRDHWVVQQYLPASLQGKVFYQPSDQGHEATLAVQVARRREAQLAAMVEGAVEAPAEILTFTGDLVDRVSDRWLQRTLSNAGARLGHLRDRLLDDVELQRHHIVLDLNAGSGLLAWEALRRVPEGRCTRWCVRPRMPRRWTRCRPTCPISAVLWSWRLIYRGCLMLLQPDLRFDAIVGRNALGPLADKPAAAGLLAGLLAPGGRIAFAETIGKHAQRLYALVDLNGLPAGLADRLAAAEEALYIKAIEPGLTWDVEDLKTAFAAAGIQAKAVCEHETVELHITPALLDRWFERHAENRLSYAQQLGSQLNEDEVTQVEALFRRQLAGQVVAWRAVSVFLTAEAAIASMGGTGNSESFTT